MPISNFQPVPHRREAAEEGVSARMSLCALFEQVLGNGPVTPDDGFFDHGGTSLLAVRLVARIHRELGRKLTIRDLFEAPSPRALAGLLEADRGHAEPPPVQVLPRSQEHLPASYPQARFWALNRLDSSSTVYNIPVVFELEGAVDPEALALALDDVVARHRVLRTVVEVVDGELRQRVLDASKASERLLVNTVSDTELDAALRDAVGYAFDIQAEPPVRGWLLRRAAERSTLVLVVHHIACDGLSMPVLTRDLALAYAARLDGGPPEWTEPPVRYTDFALWQRRALGEPSDVGSALAGHLAYWRRALRALPSELDLPSDRGRPALPSHRGGTVTFGLGTEIQERLNRLARESRATEFMVLHAVVAVLLHRFGAGEDIPVGTVVGGRPDPTFDEVVGCFVNTVVLRTDLSGSPSFRELLRRVRDADLGALEHQDVPFEQVVTMLHPERAVGRNPLFQVAAAYVTDQTPALELPGARTTLLEPREGAAKFDLTFYFVPLDGELKVRLEYAGDLFDRATAEMYARSFETLVAGLTEMPDAPVAEAALLDRDQAESVLRSRPQGEPAPVAGTLPSLFEEKVALAPDAVALVDGDRRWTYSDVNAQANQLARELVARGVRVEDRVAVALPRGVGFFVGILAAAKAGAAFVPIDVDYPTGRIEAILADASPAVVITSTGLVGQLGAAPWDVLLMDDADTAAAVTSHLAEDLVATHPHVDVDHAAYLIYTSGSTGEPKGVVVPHLGIAALVGSQRARLGLNAQSVVLQFSSAGFDAMVFEVCMALLNGARMVLITGDRRLSGPALAELVSSEGVTHMLLTPSVLAGVTVGSVPSVQTLVVGGEACSAGLVRRWAEQHKLVNAYGPTESTVCATMSAPLAADQPATIGTPVAGTQAYVLDTRLAPVPPGVAGELYLAGDGLARGYVNRPGETAVRFVANPYGPPGSRMYRTGDLARWDRAGALHFIGRADDQVKLRGFRIEPGEIERTLLEAEEVATASVLLREDRPGVKQLVVYVVPRAGMTPDPVRLRQKVARKLPDYMVPAAIVVVDALPLTSNGKLDRQALPAPVFGGGEDTPRTGEEELLCRLYAQVLDLPSVAPDESFFALGGHSLTAMYLVALARDGFGVHCEIRDLFEAPTPRALAVRAQFPDEAPRVSIS